MPQCSFTKRKIEMAPNNPSAWNYLRGCVCAIQGERQCASQGCEVALRLTVTYRRILGKPSIIDRFELSYSDHLEWAQMLQSPGDPTQAIPLALEFLADAHTGAKNTQKVHEVRTSLTKAMEYRYASGLKCHSFLVLCTDLLAASHFSRPHAQGLLGLEEQTNSSRSCVDERAVRRMQQGERGRESNPNMLPANLEV